jgi:hypothetical protein
MSVEIFTGRLLTVLLKEFYDNSEQDEEKLNENDQKRSALSGSS